MSTFHSRTYGRVRLTTHSYDDGSLAVQLVRDDDNEDIGMLSINLPEYAHLLRANQFFPKTNPSNEVVAWEALMSGCVEDTGRRVSTPIGNMPIWQCY